MRTSALLLLSLVLGCLVVAPRAGAAGPDPAARGLDLFLHLSPSVAPGGKLAIAAAGFGFPQVTRAVPLPGATVEAGWDPESLDGTDAPPNVTATTDAAGRARLELTVPQGKPGDLSVLVAIRHGAHARTRTIKVTRAAPSSVELHTADTRVVPTSTISAWVRALGPLGEPLGSTDVEVSLLEGDVARHKQTLRTDRGGIVMARVPIPRVDEPVWKWTLHATAKIEGAVPAALELRPREETPGVPTLHASWDEPPAGVLPGDRVPFAIRVRDASGQPLVGHTLRYWIGPKGTSAPADKDWEQQATAATTDGAGEISGVRSAPTLVKPSGTALTLVARTTFEGHDLKSTDDVSIGVRTATASLTPEVAALVPGLSQRVLLTVSDGRGEPVAGRFSVTGDGLAATAQTSARGEAEITWDVPRGIGATHPSGPCAGGVAAAVTVRPAEEIPALRARREPFSLCVSIDRDARAIARLEPNVARPGERVRVTIARSGGAPGRDRPRATGPGASVVLQARHAAQGTSAWLDEAAGGGVAGEIAVPEGAAPGMWDASIVVPDASDASRTLVAGLLVVPKVVPVLEARRVGGRAAPGGSIEVEARLTDGHGRGLPGVVSAIVADQFGGGRVNVSSLDTRSRLCAEVGEAGDLCGQVLERAPETDALRRARIGRSTHAATAPTHDPGAKAAADLEKAFQEVVKSLEGAVFEASASPDRLLDVRRKEGGRWTLNPELLTLVTDAMPEEPLTPGGEKITLPDLVAIDPQVTFDNVARRVTRLKLFKVLVAVRAERTSKSLDPEEPVFKDPNALLRRLVRASTITEDLLLDPWGGTIQYVRSNAPPQPFLGTVRGWELRAPGPDGVLNTADDVRDPFERVLRSGTPYAKAVQEDRIVDAKWDMVVSDDTVHAWQSLLEELTGTQFGAGGIGLGGIGTGGGGYGSGHGRLGGSHAVGRPSVRHGAAIASGDAYWSPPVRTDAEGRVRLTIPLGDTETTWTVALVGAPDGTGPASTTLAVPSELPLSVRVASGARWVEGDIVETLVTLRNRTGAPLRVTLTAAAEGAAEIADRRLAQQTVDVGARGASQAKLVVRAARPGEAKLVLTARAQGAAEDTLRHTVEVVPVGEQRALTKTSWVQGKKDLGLTLDAGYRPLGEPRLVLERGIDGAVAAALDALEPERQTSTRALLDALDAASRVQRWATTRESPRHRALAEIARGAVARARGRATAYAELDEPRLSAKKQHGEWTVQTRLLRLVAVTQGEDATPQKDAKPRGKAHRTTLDDRVKHAETLCPPADEPALDVEPPPSEEGPPCWGGFVADSAKALATETQPELLASAVLALADRPHRIAIAARLAARLRDVVRLGADGELGSSDEALRDRATRALVYAALLRTHKVRAASTSVDPSAEVLFGKLAVLRDVTGGYGSSAATLGVLRALLASELEGRGTTRARVRAGSVDRTVDVAESSFAVVPLPAGALDVSVETTGPGLVARFERPILRAWTRPPPVQASPVGIEVEWPTEARAGKIGTLRVTLKHGHEDAREIDARIALPPGATLAAPTKAASQLQGVLAIRQETTRAAAALDIPIRFGLGGTFTVPEATAGMTRGTAPLAVAPARRLVVK